jgi:hypothetical protein
MDSIVTYSFDLFYRVAGENLGIELLKDGVEQCNDFGCGQRAAHYGEANKIAYAKDRI